MIGNRSTGRKSTAFIIQIHTKMVIASGVTISLLAWKVAVTWSLTIFTTISTTFCSLPGTPEVARRAAAYISPKVIAPTTHEMIMVSRWMVQKPEPTLRLVKWWTIYSVGPVGACAAM
jgi:hypothetical protein